MGGSGGKSVIQRAELGTVAIGHMGDIEPKEVLDLNGGDDHADARGEPSGDGKGHEGDEAAETEQAKRKEDKPSHLGGND
jgi:hypothetical protein